MENIRDILSLLVGVILFKLTEIIGGSCKKQLLSLLIIIAWLFFAGLAFFFSLIVFAIITNRILKAGDNSYIFVLFMIIGSGIICCRLVLKIIKWLKLARNEA